ncbi:hypothetical protein M9H77_00928 [Catharanthus roseus]|uniref:Uncharacterized protein n=1 Tax=Catharanthus roseus TaxID=4058 RepID=A0ACC0C464_CATRO|nr:hypothetical protein M9H77_00928 [Catharanthus roseus]
MAKQREQQLVSAPRKKKNKQGSPDVDLLGEGDWVVVKKQKVTILIPTLPVTKESPALNAGENQPELNLRKIIDTQKESPAKTYSHGYSVSEVEKSLSPAPESSIPDNKTIDPQPSPSFPKLPSPSHLMTSENPKINSIRELKPPGIYRILKERKQALIFNTEKPMLNGRMRAINIEKKLQRAGGLSSWLVSLGLERFIKIFQQKNVNKFQLANLSMKKLKDMGAVAVGPRRKLMHAIDCLCQPYCFERL